MQGTLESFIFGVLLCFLSPEKKEKINSVKENKNKIEKKRIESCSSPETCKWWIHLKLKTSNDQYEKESAI